MSSDLTSPPPVDEPTGAEIAPPRRPTDGSAVDGLRRRRPRRGRPAARCGRLRLTRVQLTGTDGRSLDGIAARSLDVANPQDTAPHAVGEPGLAGQFAAVARALASEQTVAATLRQVVETARVIVPGCHHAGVTVLRRGRPETPAATDEVSAAVEAEAIGTILVAHAALAFARAREREQISGPEQAVASNRSIGMAIGILMAIRRIGQDEAFDLLRRVSQRTNRKLREIADEVVHTGQLPEAPPR